MEISPSEAAAEDWRGRDGRKRSGSDCARRRALDRGSCTTARRAQLLLVSARCSLGSTAGAIPRPRPVCASTRRSGIVRPVRSQYLLDTHQPPGDLRRDEHGRAPGHRPRRCLGSGLLGLGSPGVAGPSGADVHAKVGGRPSGGERYWLKRTAPQSRVSSWCLRPHTVPRRHAPTSVRPLGAVAEYVTVRLGPPR